MTLNQKKKIYIIGSNPYNFLDITLESFNKIKECDCVIISKSFKQKFVDILKKNCKRYVFEEDLSPSKGLKLWINILELSKKYTVLSHLKTSDPIFLDNGNAEKDFFEKNRIKAEIFLGVIQIVYQLNKKKDFLTDRKKNSSITFIKKLEIKKLEQILINGGFGKLIIKLNKNFEILKKINSLKIQFEKKSSYRFKIIIGKKIQKFNLKILNSVDNFKDFENHIYLIVSK